MNISANDLILMLRNVTGRVDASDPQFTDSIMLDYLQKNIQLITTQDVRLFKNRTWYEFELGVDDLNPFPVDLQNIVLVNGNIGAAEIIPPAYANGFNIAWYEDPAVFYSIWPETQTYQPSRPTYVLYYNNELTFRNPVDQNYLIKIAAYQVELQIGENFGDADQDNTNLNQAYLFRYIVYSTALDIFSDYGEMDKWQSIQAPFMRYRALVYSRTYSQQQNQRPYPEF